MRTRLSIHISLFAVGLVLWQLQSVLAQKYYMNFAFNNNNPDGKGNGGDGSMYVPPTNDGQSNRPDPEDGSGDRGSVDSDEPENNEDGGDDDGDDTDDSGDSDDNENDKDEDGSDDGSGDSDSGSDDTGDDDNDSQKSGVPGLDDDNDDSDSHDSGNREFKDVLDENKGPDEHSHHSSYEISIDDSFGGRYVRSIYESSESHGHSGSNAGSGSARLADGAGDSSASKGSVQFDEDDYEEPNEDV